MNTNGGFSDSSFLSSGLLCFRPSWKITSMLNPEGSLWKRRDCPCFSSYGTRILYCWLSADRDTMVILLFVRIMLVVKLSVAIAGNYSFNSTVVQSLNFIANCQGTWIWDLGWECPFDFSPYQLKHLHFGRQNYYIHVILVPFGQNGMLKTFGQTCVTLKAELIFLSAHP